MLERYVDHILQNNIYHDYIIIVDVAIVFVIVILIALAWELMVFDLQLIFPESATTVFFNRKWKCSNVFRVEFIWFEEWVYKVIMIVVLIHIPRYNTEHLMEMIWVM